MAEIGQALGETIGRTVANASPGRRVRLGVGGTISAVGLVALAAHAVALVAG